MLSLSLSLSLSLARSLYRARTLQRACITTVSLEVPGSETTACRIDKIICDGRGELVVDLESKCQNVALVSCYFRFGIQT